MAFTFDPNNTNIQVDVYNKKIYYPIGTTRINSLLLYTGYLKWLHEHPEDRGHEPLIFISGNQAKGGGLFTPILCILLKGVRIVLQRNNGKKINLETEIISQDAGTDLYEASGEGDGAFLVPAYGNLVTVNSDMFTAGKEEEENTVTMPISF